MADYEVRGLKRETASTYHAVIGKQNTYIVCHGGMFLLVKEGVRMCISATWKNNGRMARIQGIAGGSPGDLGMISKLGGSDLA